MGCKSVLHQMHLCALTVAGDEVLVKALTEKPTVECVTCGARANDSKNVCSPRQLPDIA